MSAAQDAIIAESLHWLESVPSGLRWWCRRCDAAPVSGLGELDYEQAWARMRHTPDCPALASYRAIAFEHATDHKEG